MTHNDPTLGTFGEKGYLRELLPRLRKGPMMANDFGDDAAVIRSDVPFQSLAYKIDRASRPVALDYTPADFGSWGRMAVTANCSDLLACGANPIAFMVAVLAPATESARHIDQILLGVDEECQRRGISFAGGDLKESSATEIIGTAIGTIPAGPTLGRGGVRPGDVLYCAGAVGGFAAARLLLEDAGERLGKEGHTRCLNYLANPVAQWEAGMRINQLGLAHAAMDASDGLYEVFRVMSGDECAILIDLDHSGYHPLTGICTDLLGIDPRSQMFGAGDWNIIYAVRSELAATFETAVRDLAVFRIGRAERGEGVVGFSKGRRVGIKPIVHEHFRSRIEQSGSYLEFLKGAGLVEGT